ncbi:hypothetical protein GCM10010145_06550 [Streptomyces ruber]|uniref:Uncharacterized protein n=2 Tax=Streptomyces TaxID=1883 RepID=A0A918BAY6_9ACTN|nr:hypothetical protein [Streptomyces ruber]GGQ41069.1 hypothetical protein GCM10010145_06550 [Streptomyces ruber]
MTDTAPTPVPTVTDDDRHGAVSVELSGEHGDTLVVTGGDAIPRVVLTRAPEAEVDEQIVIGTRDPRHLRMTVGGDDAEITPARGRLTRRSYRVDVSYAGAAYRLVPVSVGTSRLTRDGKRLGKFSSDGDLRVIAEWEEGAEVVPADAAVGYALAAAFGTGGQSLWTAVVEVVSEALP